MLIKLLKYDIKAQIMSVLPVYVIVLGLSVLLYIMEKLKGIYPLLTGIYGLLLIVCVVGFAGIFIWTLITSVRQFYLNIVKEEGYLTNTLPVSKNQIVISKEIASCIMMVIAIVFAIPVAMLVFFHGDVLSLVSATIDSIAKGGVHVYLYLVYFILVMLIGYIWQITLFFAAIMLGQTRDTNKVLFAVVFGILLYFAMQVLSLIGIGLNVLIDPKLTDLIVTDSIVAVNPSPADVWSFLGAMLITSSIITIIMIIVNHIICIYIAKKRLNLE